MKDNVFNPNLPGQANGNYFGLPFTINDSCLVLMPVPWDVTTSYGAGTVNGPRAILEASLQIDLHDLQYGSAWEKGISTDNSLLHLSELSHSLRPLAEKVIRHQEQGGKASDKDISNTLKIVNKECGKMTREVYKRSAYWIKKGVIPGLVGGDHSVPLGMIKAVADYYPSFGILHIDAHADLRKAYEGFIYSHASIMHNALKLPGLRQLVQVGIRDVCTDEISRTIEDERIRQFSSFDISNRLFAGSTWQQLCREIVICLPENVYISFDIDGLDPSLCPNTGTPVPGGLSFEQACYLLYELLQNGKNIVGFDLCEVAPGRDEWDANVGARILFKIASLCCSE